MSTSAAIFLAAAAGLGVLVLLLLALGPLLDAVPRQALHLAIGLLLVLFGAGWLRKAILRGAGRMSRHDQDAEFGAARAELSQPGVAAWVAGIAAFKTVLLEGLEVIFVIVALGGATGLGAAAAGAAAACLLVFAAAAALRRPLARLPENALKFWTGVMLVAFGTYWVAEGLGGAWPGADWALLYLAAGFAALGGGLIRHLARQAAEAAR